LHVLSTPPAFVLSQDQTLQQKCMKNPTPKGGRPQQNKTNKTRTQALTIKRHTVEFSKNGHTPSGAARPCPGFSLPYPTPLCLQIRLSAGGSWSAPQGSKSRTAHLLKRTSSGELVRIGPSGLGHLAAVTASVVPPCSVGLMRLPPLPYPCQIHWGGADESACRPGSVPGPGGPGGDHPSGPTVAGGLVRSTRRLGRAALVRLRRRRRTDALLTLLRVGFTEPPGSPRALVVSYTTVSPLPARTPAVCSLWHCPAGHPGLPLATTLPCGARTFLDCAVMRRRGRPAGSSAVPAIVGGGRRRIGWRP
jgi:hypothetical protein